jgi:hypothetical protein
MGDQPISIATGVTIETTITLSTSVSDTPAFSELRTLLADGISIPTAFIEHLKSSGIVDDFHDFFIFCEFPFQDMFYQFDDDDWISSNQSNFTWIKAFHRFAVETMANSDEPPLIVLSSFKKKSFKMFRRKY